MGSVGHVVSLAGDRAVDFQILAGLKTFRSIFTSGRSNRLGKRRQHVAYKGGCRLIVWQVDAIEQVRTVAAVGHELAPATPSPQATPRRLGLCLRPRKCSSSVAEIPAGLVGSKSIGSQRRRIMSPSLVVVFGWSVELVWGPGQQRGVDFVQDHIDARRLPRVEGRRRLCRFVEV